MYLFLLVVNIILISLLHPIICPDSGEQADKTVNGFRTVSRPLVLQKTFR